LKPIVDGLAGEQWARRRKTGESSLNSEGFRETLSEERQRGPKKAKMAGRNEAKTGTEGPHDQRSGIGRGKAESSLETTGNLAPVYRG
jgi:hypothetical protein